MGSSRGPLKDCGYLRSFGYNRFISPDLCMFTSLSILTLQKLARISSIFEFPISGVNVLISLVEWKLMKFKLDKSVRNYWI